MGWILRIFFLIAAPIAAWLVARDAANFEVVQGFVVILLISGVPAVGGAMEQPPPHRAALPDRAGRPDRTAVGSTHRRCGPPMFIAISWRHWIPPIMASCRPTEVPQPMKKMLTFLVLRSRLFAGRRAGDPAVIVALASAALAIWAAIALYSHHVAR